MSRSLLALTAMLLLAHSAAAADIPGLEYIGRGVDVTTMAMGLQQITQNQFNMWYYWTNPFTNISYNVPEMMFAETITETVQDRNSANFNSLAQYQAWAKHTRTWSSGFLGMDSHSKTTFQYLNQHFNHNRSLVRTFKDVLYYKLWAPIPIPQVTAEFKSLVDLLPETFNGTASDYAKYKQFFRSVGSAIMTEGYFGGRMTADSWYESCLNTLYKDSWVKEESGWNFCLIIGDYKGHNSTKHSNSTKFKKCSTTTTTFLGGDSASGAGSPLKWKDWAKTIMGRPVPVKMTLTPIHEAISWDTVKAASVKSALARYMNESLAEMLLYEHRLKESAPSVQPQEGCCSP